MTQMERLGRDTRSAEARDPRTYAIIGAAMEVHRVPDVASSGGLSEDAMAIELLPKAFRSSAKWHFRFVSRGSYSALLRSDFICVREVIVELKALAQLSSIEIAVAALPEGYRFGDRITPDRRFNIA